MEKLLKEYLDTVYDSTLNVEWLIGQSFKEIGVFCKDECIVNGIVHESKDYSHISWNVPYSTWRKIVDYIPAVDPNDYMDIVLWVIDKCKKQNISLPGLN